MASLLAAPSQAGADGGPTAGVFALLGKTGRTPRVYACAQRSAFLKAVQVRLHTTYPCEIHMSTAVLAEAGRMQRPASGRLAATAYV